MAQTAVQWLTKIYQQTGKIDIFDLEVAKEMEKERIKFAYNDGAEHMVADKYKAMEDYYNEQYGK
jgi:hypothetical protein